MATCSLAASRSSTTCERRLGTTRTADGKEPGAPSRARPRTSIASTIRSSPTRRRAASSSTANGLRSASPTATNGCSATTRRASPSDMDLERFRLRRFLQSLPAEELERLEAAVALGDVAARLEGNARAVWFASAGGAELAGNVAASRTRLAAALGSAPKTLLAEVMRRLATPQDTVEVREAPVQQVVQTADADLTVLPVHLQHGFDGAPYISLAMDVTRDPASGLTNVGIRRLMLRGRREAGVDLNAPSDLRAIYQAAVQRGE